MCYSYKMLITTEDKPFGDFIARLKFNGLTVNRITGLKSASRSVFSAISMIYQNESSDIIRLQRRGRYNILKSFDFLIFEKISLITLFPGLTCPPPFSF